MRNEYLRGNQTTWANTDARIRPLTFYEPDLQRRIAIRELGEEDEFNDFTNHLGNMKELQHEQGMGESTAESKSLIQGHRINNSTNKTGTSGPLADRITKNVDLRQRKKIGNRFGNWQNKESFE